MTADDFAADRTAALVVACETCFAGPDAPCVNLRTGEPLHHLPAHVARLKAAGRIPPLPSDHPPYDPTRSLR